MIRRAFLSWAFFCVTAGCSNTTVPSAPPPADVSSPETSVLTDNPAPTDVFIEDRAPADVPSSTDVPVVTDAPRTDDAGLAHFSFFVTSWAALQRLSGNQNGFGGDLRFGETGAGAGLRGADRICASIAETSMPGAGRKPWRAFLSATNGGDGRPVHAIDRVGEGPWYDRLGRIVAMNRAALLNARPAGAHAAIVNDLPNEDGVPNHRPDPTRPQVDNHHMLTGSTVMGTLYNATATCLDWTSAEGNRAVSGRPRVGLSWPRGTGGGVGAQHWISALDEAGCAPGATLFGMGGPVLSNPTVGSGGGYGGFYCFSLIP